MRVLLAAALLALAAAADEAPPRGAFERPIALVRPGRAAVTLDRDVYERARADLGDLRVLDERGQAVPYILERALEEETGRRQPRLLNRTFVRGASSGLTLDYGEPALKNEVALSLSGDNFRRRVKVEGQERPDGPWQTLTDGAYVFAVPGPPPARYETVALPENNYQYLRVTVYDGPDDHDPVLIAGAWSRRLQRREPREQAVPLTPRVVEDARLKETQVLADLGARHQPVRGLVLEVSDREFFRGVEVEQRVDAGTAQREPAWTWLGTGSLYRYHDAGVAYEKLGLDFAAQARVVRLRIRNLDDRPLHVTGARLLVPVERVGFEAEAGHTYRLAYGSERLGPPRYDLARTVGDVAAWMGEAGEGVLGPVTRLEGPALHLPWTERHPALVWALLAALVAGLGVVTWRALRGEGASMKMP